MRGLWKFTWTEIKLFLREPMAFFFTLIFPLMMLFLFGSMYGNEPMELFGGYGSVDVSVPAYMAMIIGTTGLISLTISMASYREKGVLRRLRATPLRPQAILIAEVLMLLLITVVGVALLVVAAKVVYGLRFSGHPLSVVAAFLLSTMSFFALGFVLASLAPTARTGQVVAMVLFYPMLFLSGASVPWETLPEGVKRFARFLPLTHVVALLRGLWTGEPWSAHLTNVGVLAGVLVMGVVVSVITFRWE